MQKKTIVVLLVSLFSLVWLFGFSWVGLHLIHTGHPYIGVIIIWLAASLRVDPR